MATGKAIPIHSLTQLTDFPPDMVHPFSKAGAAVMLHDPRDGRVLATLLPIPEMAQEVARARPIEVGAKPIEMGAKAIEIGAKAIEIGAKDALAAANEWMVITPEGYFDCSANAAQFIKWNVNG